MKTIAVIPARGGSKRIPHKNIKDFCGKPIIARTIETVVESRLFSRVIVSTDCQKIAEIAQQAGAECPFLRPPELARDEVPLLPVIRHALAWFEEKYEPPVFACLVMPTAPLLTSTYLVKGLQRMEETGASCVLAVTTFSHPVQRALCVTESGRLSQLFPDKFEMQTNDLPEAYRDAAQFCWFRVSSGVHLEDSVPPRDTVPVLLPRLIAQDIDTPEDWEFAEQVYRLIHIRGNQ